MSGLESAVATIMDRCLGVGPTEHVLVVTDAGARPVAEPLYRAARSRAAESVLVEMQERETHGSEPPGPVAAAMLACDVLLAPTTKSLSHTEARRAATDKGVRIATLPNVTADMLIRTMTADYDEVARRSRAVAEALTVGSRVSLRSEAGTELELSIEGREGIRDDGDLTAPGAFGNLPAGEGFIAPVEGTATGRLVLDGAVFFGRLEDPIVIEVEGGYARSFDGGRADEFRAALEPHGPEAFAVAELGVGTNERAVLTGNVLEDEKVLGTVHVALGGNFAFGGTVRVASHQDGIVLAPTLRIDGEALLEAGSPRF